jgi:hypothetical protein
MLGIQKYIEVGLLGCGLVGRYHHCGETYCLHLQGLRFNPEDEH